MELRAMNVRTPYNSLSSNGVRDRAAIMLLREGKMIYKRLVMFAKECEGSESKREAEIDNRDLKRTGKVKHEMDTTIYCLYFTGILFEH